MEHKDVRGLTEVHRGICLERMGKHKTNIGRNNQFTDLWCLLPTQSDKEKGKSLTQKT
jgi:hypothetical protein